MEPEAGLSQRRGFTTEEEMKESLPNEFMLTQGDAIDILAAKYAFFEEDCEIANNIRRIGEQKPASPDVQ